jgi:PAS domain S-box-containing protein
LVVALAVASLGLLLGLIWQKTDMLARVAALTPQVTTHSKINATLHALNVDVLALQASRRAFLMTAREEHITAFEESATKLNNNRNRLRTLIASDAIERGAVPSEQLQRLDVLVPAFVDQLRKSIRLRIESPMEIAQQERLTDDTLATSRQIVGDVEALITSMDRQMQSQVGTLANAAERAQASDGWLSAVALATVALGFGVAGLQMRRKSLVQGELEHAKHDLEQRVALRTASLAENEHRYRTLVELSADAVLLVNRSLMVEYANAAARELMNRLGQPAVTGQSVDVLLGSLLWQPMSRQLEGLWQAPAALPYQVAVLRGAKGIEVPVQWTAASHAAPPTSTETPTGSGESPTQVRYVQIIVHDLTALRNNEQEARERTLFIDQLIEAMPVPVSVRDEQGRFVRVNAAFEAAYEVQRDRLSKQTPFDLIPEETAWEITRQDAYAARSMSSVSYEFHQPVTGGATRDVLAHARALRRSDGRLQGVVTVETDITALREKEVELSQANSELIRLSTDLRQTQERERRHIARELHDQVGQVLTALKMSISAMASEANVPQPLLQKRLAIVDEALRHTRSLSRTLHPHVLEDLGLAAGLESLVEQYVGPGSPSIELDLRIEPARSHPDHELTAYRIAQEALTNALRHAGARSMHIKAACDGGWLALSVSDDGKGFVATGKPASSLGLVSMRERLHDLGGELNIDSAPGAGTTVRAWLPWSPVVDASEPVRPNGKVAKISG